MNIENAFGKIFQATDGQKFGVIRSLSGSLPSEFETGSVMRPIAEDGCGNYFVLKNDTVQFWDHESAEIRMLAANIADFLKGCSIPESVKLKEGQVESAWIDPEFAKDLGVDKP